MNIPARRGEAAERLAEKHLIAQGLVLIERNFQGRRGEIDLVMRDGRCLVFVEVRFRSSDRFGSAAESITPVKQGRLLATADYFLQSRKGWRDNPCRFDVLTLSGRSDTRIDWIKDAFHQ